MPKNFNFQLPKNPVGIAKVAAVALLVFNLIAAYFVFYTPGGSPKELEEQAQSLRAQVLQRTLLLKQTRANVQRIEIGRSGGDKFLTNYFLSERATSSMLIEELSRAARDSKITLKEHSIQKEEIEGSDSLHMASITGSYEGTYADLISFIHKIDQSDRLLIIESLNATPQQGKGRLNVNIKMDAFILEDATGGGLATPGAGL